MFGTQKRGRKSKPTAIKRLEGNPGKRKLGDDDFVIEASIPDCPEWIGDVARKEWERVAPELYKYGLLTELDHAALEAYCVSYQRWLEAEEIIRNTGFIVRGHNGMPVINPALSIAQNCLNQLRAFAALFGMTASSRSNLALKKQKGSSGEDNGWEGLLS